MSAHERAWKFVSFEIDAGEVPACALESFQKGNCYDDRKRKLVRNNRV